MVLQFDARDKRRLMQCNMTRDKDDETEQTKKLETEKSSSVRVESHSHHQDGDVGSLLPIAIAGMV